MSGFLIVDPRLGSGSPTADELCTAAGALGLAVHVLAAGDDLAALARDAPADVIGMAGGDGARGAVAAAAAERDIPFACIPFGTRNRFARDLGLDRGDPLAALHGRAGALRVAVPPS